MGKRLEKSMRLVVRAVAGAVVVAALASCGSGGDTTTASTSVSSSAVPTVHATADGVTLSLDVPDGALPDGVALDDVTIEPREPEDVGESLPLAAFELGPDGTVFEEPVLATVTAPYESGAVIAPYLASAGAEPERLELLSQEIDQEAVAIVATFEIEHFSRLVLGIDDASLEVVQPDGATATVVTERSGPTPRDKKRVLKVDTGAHRVGDRVPVTFRVTEPAVGEFRFASYTFDANWYGGGTSATPSSDENLVDSIFEAMGHIPDAVGAADSPSGSASTDHLSPIIVVEDAGSPGKVGLDGSGESSFLGSILASTDVAPIPPSDDPFRPGSAEFSRVFECVRVGTFEVTAMVFVRSEHGVTTVLIARVSGSCVADGAGDDDSGTVGDDDSPTEGLSATVELGGANVTATSAGATATDGKLLVRLCATDADGNPIVGKELYVSLGDPPSHEDATHGSGVTGDDGCVEIELDVTWPQGTTTLFTSDGDEVVAVGEVVIESE